MSHTTTLVDDEGRRWTLIHNGDWSGDVRLTRHDLNGVEIEPSVIPGAIIRQACARAVLSDLSGILDEWDGSTKAAHRAQDALRTPR